MQGKGLLRQIDHLFLYAPLNKQIVIQDLLFAIFYFKYY